MAMPEHALAEREKFEKTMTPRRLEVAAQTLEEMAEAGVVPVARAHAARAAKTQWDELAQAHPGRSHAQLGKMLKSTLRGRDSHGVETAMRAVNAEATR